MKKIKKALVSVYHKEGLREILKKLDSDGVEIYSTGGTWKYLFNLGIDAKKVEDITGYPSILGGRVKTLHPKVFGGILARMDQVDDQNQLSEYDIPAFDLVIVDLYPFEETVASSDDEAEIIEKIDIGGISLIRAAAKNYKDVVVIPSKDYYPDLFQILESNSCQTTLEQRKVLAMKAFKVSSHYDAAIFKYFNGTKLLEALTISEPEARQLRYGENPHQNGIFYGHLEDMVSQISGKEISYNNLLDIDAAVRLISDFDETTVAILKHNNACGIASSPILVDAWEKALAGDPVSAFGGIIVSNTTIDFKTAQEIDKLFYEVLIAPDFSYEALEILKKKGTRIILKLKSTDFPEKIIRSAMNGYLLQDTDRKTESRSDMNVVTEVSPSNQEFEDLVFANKMVKHTKSNAMVIVKNKQLIASGLGETSRVDAFKQALEKAKGFKKDVKGAVLASDAFFPFADNVELAFNAGINAIVQPGGSKRDEDSIDFCNKNGMAMCFTGIRHFKH
jgi:phosphoribosylaminoimidazolecarboxamide formyltransferase / IMP cyclohydrolase